MSEGLDVWCYDALETRVFESNYANATTVLRSLEVIETFWDSNPAMFVTVLLARRSIEDYLAGAPATDPAAQYLREVRVPGPTTHVELQPAAAVGWWSIDGSAPHAWPESLPGSSAAGMTDDTPPAQRVPRWRAVVAPGSHAIRYSVAGAQHEQTIDIAAGQRLVITVGNEP